MDTLKRDEWENANWFQTWLQLAGKEQDPMAQGR